MDKARVALPLHLLLPPLPHPLLLRSRLFKSLSTLRRFPIPRKCPSWAGSNKFRHPGADCGALARKLHLPPARLAIVLLGPTQIGSAQLSAGPLSAATRNEPVAAAKPTIIDLWIFLAPVAREDSNGPLLEN